ncbi:MAG: hypothetical protein H7A23_02310 [Leptospiraceae bacterium]|nr:hypothetical protein [Leptospiraceae bacterium]MCP5493364.1 hypothetical protein [Leptospiraceae bacterium]
MIIKKLITKKELKKFHQFGTSIYKKNIYYRSTEDDVAHLLVDGPTFFHKHSKVIPCLVEEKGRIVARFAFIKDNRMENYLQIAFFEAISGIDNLYNAIKEEARQLFPNCKKICIGLNGHLNYGAGILLNKFDETPIFGLPYTHEYYPEYFKDLGIQKVISFRFPTEGFKKYLERVKNFSYGREIKIRSLNKRRLKEDIKIYTELNNKCFQKHPFWTNRSPEEDLELFKPFRFLLAKENILFADYLDKPIGFLMWFPDFNQLVNGNQKLRAGHSLSYDVLRMKLKNPINTFRFAEVGVLPEYKKTGVIFKLMNQMMQDVLKFGYTDGEGGFIFESNYDSINLARRYIERITSKKVDVYREYAIFEEDL